MDPLDSDIEDEEIDDTEELKSQDSGSDEADNLSDDEEVDEEIGEEIAEESKTINEGVNPYLNTGSDSDSDDDENYLQKFDQELTNNYIINNHPEDLVQNYSEVLTLSKIVRDDEGNIIDRFHKTNPILSKYEKTKILGLRTKQLNEGAPPLIKLSENIIDSYLIAEMELKEKKIPFIIQRPLSNGTSEYWALEDLEIL
jgi:DNA-directed RNA polymerase subunit K/omega